MRIAESVLERDHCLLGNFLWTHIVDIVWLVGRECLPTPLPAPLDRKSARMMFGFTLTPGFPSNQETNSSD